jgi:transcriptional regulator with XRE-family HTH domain
MKGTFKNIAALSRTYRNRTPYSQGDVARQMGYRNDQFMSNVERGLCNLPPKHIPKFCRILNVPTSVVVDAMVADFRATLEAEVGLAEITESAIESYKGTSTINLSSEVL